MARVVLIRTTPVSTIIVRTKYHNTTVVLADILVRHYILTDIPARYSPMIFSILTALRRHHHRSR
jgi:hypothetical protein